MWIGGGGLATASGGAAAIEGGATAFDTLTSSLSGASRRVSISCVCFVTILPGTDVAGAAACALPVEVVAEAAGRVLIVVVCAALRFWRRSVWRMCIASLRAVLAVCTCCAIFARARIAGVGMICSTVAHSAMLLAAVLLSTRLARGFCCLPGITGESEIEGNRQDVLLRGGAAILSRDRACLGTEWTGVKTGAIRCSCGASDGCFFVWKIRCSREFFVANDPSHSLPNNHDSARMPIAISANKPPTVPSTFMKL